MMTDTQHFVVSIDEGGSQGVYCAYCGEKIIPCKSEEGVGFVFQCHCKDAECERELGEAKEKAEQNLEKFLTSKTDSMQINECLVRIGVYEQHTLILKEKVRELRDKVITLASIPSVNKGKFPLEDISELSLSPPDPEPEGYLSFMGIVSPEDANSPKK